MPRHKKNAAIHKLEGTYRKDRHANPGYDESQVARLVTSVPECPPTIKTEYARLAWASMIPPLYYTQRIAEEDLYVLENAFRSLDRAEHYQAELDVIEASRDAIENHTIIVSYAGMVKGYRQQFLDVMTKKFGCSSQDRLAMGKVIAGRWIQSKSLLEKMTE